jgi:hypothetical protein
MGQTGFRVKGPGSRNIKEQAYPSLYPVPFTLVLGTNISYVMNPGSISHGMTTP